MRGGDLGSLPVVVGLVVISIGFYLKNPAFLSSFTVVSMMQFAAPVGIISLGIVLVLLVGEIDLSVGSVSGLAERHHGRFCSSTTRQLDAGLAGVRHPGRRLDRPALRRCSTTTVGVPSS